LAAGLTIIVIGLVKKTLLADGIADYADYGFRVATTAPLQLLESWSTALAFTFQIYFDFSGYADVAIGVAALFGVRLPANFDSPYKASSIVGFWWRWHMTLGRFLRDFVYIPLGGHRAGAARRHLSLVATMAIGGLWHGAALTFVAWGALHGVFLVIAHAWQLVRPVARNAAERLAGWALTFLAVVSAWVVFRADSPAAAGRLLRGMAGAGGIDLPYAVLDKLGAAGALLRRVGVAPTLTSGSFMLHSWLWILALGAIALLAPNTGQLMRHHPVVAEESGALERPADYGGGPAWRMSRGWALATAVLAVIVLFKLTDATQFLPARLWR
jgi:hypothetical protein